MRAVVSWLGVAGLLAAGTAHAAPYSAKGSSPAVKAQSSVAAVSGRSSAAAKEEHLTRTGCVQERKRLWVEGQGWMIRTVPVCPETFSAR
jgi:hypothetical protein